MSVELPPSGKPSSPKAPIQAEQLKGQKAGPVAFTTRENSAATTRVKIGEVSSHFFVSTMEFDPKEKGVLNFLKNIVRKMHQYFHYETITVTAGGKSQDVSVNVNSLSKRFFIPKDQIKTAAREGKLTNLVAARAKLFAKYHFEGRSMKTHGKQDVPVSFAELTKVADKMASTDKGQAFAIPNFYGFSNHNHVMYFGNSQGLGAGRTGTVSKVFDVAQARFVAYKTMTSDQVDQKGKGPDKWKEFTNELQMQEYFAKNQNLTPEDRRFLQPKYYASDSGINEVAKRNEIYVAHYLYEGGNFADWASPNEYRSQADRLRMCKNLYEGLYVLDIKAKAFHNDIVDGNIFIEKDGTPAYCDYGLAQRIYDDEDGDPLPHHFNVSVKKAAPDREDDDVAFALISAQKEAMNDFDRLSRLEERAALEKTTKDKASKEGAVKGLDDDEMTTEEKIKAIKANLKVIRAHMNNLKRFIDFKSVRDHLNYLFPADSPSAPIGVKNLLKEMNAEKFELNKPVDPNLIQKYREQWAQL